MSKLAIWVFLVAQSRPDEGNGTISIPRSSEATSLELHDLRAVLLKYAAPTSPEGIPYIDDDDGRPTPELDPVLIVAEPTEVTDAILDSIQQLIAPGTWAGEHTIEKTPNQQLLVNHVPGVNEEIRKFLGAIVEFCPEAWDTQRSRQLQGAIRRLAAGDGRAHVHLKDAGPIAILALEDALTNGTDVPFGAIKEAHVRLRAYWRSQIADLLANLEDDDVGTRCEAEAALTKLTKSATGFVAPLLRTQSETTRDPEALARIRAVLSVHRPVRLSDAVNYWNEGRSASTPQSLDGHR